MLAGDVEVDEVLANNNVGDTITIISNLKIQKNKDFRDTCERTVTVMVISSGIHL